MFKEWRAKRLVRSVARKIISARRTGEGTYYTEWNHDGTEAAGVDAVIESIVSWCRQTVGGCRRPWGIDHFDLTLAFAVAGNASDRRVRSTRFHELRPIDLYAPDGLAQQIGTFLSRVLHEDGPLPRKVMHTGAALFSWGDAAHAALPAQT
jgi:hypothetical protein